MSVKPSSPSINAAAGMPAVTGVSAKSTYAQPQIGHSVRKKFRCRTQLQETQHGSRCAIKFDARIPPPKPTDSRTRHKRHLDTHRPWHTCLPLPWHHPDRAKRKHGHRIESDLRAFGPRVRCHRAASSVGATAPACRSSPEASITRRGRRAATTRPASRGQNAVPPRAFGRCR